MATRVDTVIETERLILRVPRTDDLDGFVELMTDEEAARYIGKVQAPPVVWRGLAVMAGSWLLNGFGMFSVIEKASGRWVGRLGPWQPEGWPGTEVGWGLSRDVWGRGYATEGATAAMDYAFDVLGWTEAVHTIEPANTGSQAVARRLGSTILRQARMPAPFEDMVLDVWGQSREQWLARRAAR